jgi:hypothetical protein
MKILEALDELARYHNASTILITPSNRWKTLMEVMVDEVIADEVGIKDPNSYELNILEGIYYHDKNGRPAGMAYRLKG